MSSAYGNKPSPYGGGGSAYGNDGTRMPSTPQYGRPSSYGNSRSAYGGGQSNKDTMSTADIIRGAAALCIIGHMTFIALMIWPWFVC